MQQNNNFDFLRLAGAGLVLIGHAFPLMGMKQPQFIGNPISVIGVLIFFSVSGYLITGSWISDPHMGRYFARRALRIFPALAVVTLLSAFVLGPIITSLTTHRYFESARTYTYLLNIALYVVYDLPGVFSSNPIPHAVNDSLWSLPAEFFMYATVPAIALLFTKSRAAACIATIFAFSSIGVYLGYVRPDLHIVLYATEVRAACAMGAYFIAGSLFRISESKIAFNKNFFIVALIGCVALPHFFGGWWRYPVAAVSSFVIPYIVLTFGTRSTPILRSAGKVGDLSYGMYLYSFPIQQIIAQHNQKIGVISAIATALPATILCAWISWHLIEKTALRLKPSTRSKQAEEISITSAAQL